MSTKTKAPKKWRRMRRKFTDDMAKRLRRISLKTGGHEDPGRAGSFQGACVMEALALVSGQTWTDWPVCVSDVITSYAQYLNDTTEDQKQRNRLKKLVPIVMGTAPLVTDGKVERKDAQDPAYKEAEKKRTQLVVDFANEHGLMDQVYSHYDGTADHSVYVNKPYTAKRADSAGYAIAHSADIPFKDKLNLAVDLARAKKFNGQKVDDFLPAGGRL